MGIEEAVLARLVDAGITAVLSGMNHETVVDLVRERQRAGDNADQITDMLEAKRIALEQSNQAKIDRMPG